jgi:hypothetical protein
MVDIEAATLICTLCNLHKAALAEINLLKDHLQQDKKDLNAEVSALKFEIVQLKTELSNLSSLTNTQLQIKTSPSPASYSSKVKNTDRYSASVASKLKPPQYSCLDQFIKVKNGAKPKIINEADPISVQNTFSVLVDDVSVPSSKLETVLFGDSMVSHQTAHFCFKKPGRNVYSYSGHSLQGPKRLINKIEEFTNAHNQNTSFILQVGTNDLLNEKHRTTPLALIEKYRVLLCRLRDTTGSNKICILGMLPVLFESLDDICDRKHFNYLLSNLASEENINFVSFWDKFAHPPDYQKFFDTNGLHLSRIGNVYLGNLLNDYVQNFPKATKILHQS